MKPLTEGERAIWAAAFVKAYDISRPPYDAVKPGNDKAWTSWEQDQCASAVEVAWATVYRLRGVWRRVVEGWGEYSDVTTMLRDMLGDTVAPNPQRDTE
jgi:hypothetical protein